MKKERLLVFVVFSLLILAHMAGTGFAQGQAKAQGVAGVAKQGEATLTIKGKIDYDKKLGGYFLSGEEPGGEFFIVNPNTQVLKKLKASAKIVTIEAHTTKGAEYLYIEKIDGKKYSATKKTQAKPAAK